MNERVWREWHNRVVAEYRSSALTAQVVHGLLRCGLPEELVRTGLRIVADELDHARLSQQVLMELGGPLLPPSLQVEQLTEPEAPEGPLATLIQQVVRNFCLGETFAVPLFAAMWQQDLHPAVTPVLERILRDEAVHRAFGWEALDALLVGEPAAAAFVAERLPAWIEGFRLSYGIEHDLPPLSTEELSAGLLHPNDYARIYRQCLQEDILPRFARRGIEIS